MAETPAKRRKVASQRQIPNNLSFEDFAPGGDVVFIVKGETRVRVYSDVMKYASKVFAAMLGPNFKEGHALAKASAAPVEIPLPEDAPEPFGWICRALHCQASTTVWKPITTQLVSVWILVHKYDMEDSMQLSLGFWLNEKFNDGEINVDDLWLLTQITCASQDAGSFTVVTHKLMLRTTTSFLHVASTMESRTEPIIQGRLLYKLAATLQEARDSVVARLVRLLYSEIPATLSKCRSANISYWDLRPLEFLVTEGSLESISSVITQIINWASNTPCRCTSEKSPHNTQTLRELASRFLELEMTGGLCFYCFEGSKLCPDHKK